MRSTYGKGGERSGPSGRGGPSGATEKPGESRPAAAAAATGGENGGSYAEAANRILNTRSNKEVEHTQIPYSK